MLGGMKTFSCKNAPPFGYQTVQTMDPSELEFPQESPAEKKRAGSGQSAGKICHTVWNTCRKDLEAGAKTMNDVSRMGRATP